MFFNVSFDENKKGSQLCKPLLFYTSMHKQHRLTCEVRNDDDGCAFEISWRKNKR
jgi:hypothetical protein